MVITPIAAAVNAGLQTTRGKVCNLENEMRKLPQHEMPIKHYFANGFYAREMTMPKDSAVVGKIHKSEHLCIISQGVVDVASEERTERISAPFTYVSKPGAKRAIYAHEDTVWTTVHLSDETDIEKLEDELIAESFLQIENEDRACLG